MAGNPQVSQGVLNRVAASVVVSNFPDLNVTASYLARAGVSLSLTGEMAEVIGTLTGVVGSPETYVIAEVTIALLKSQALSDQWKQQWEATTGIGDISIRPDVSPNAGLSTFSIVNCQITSVREMTFAGSDPAMIVTLRGAYQVNNNLWSSV